MGSPRERFPPLATATTATIPVHTEVRGACEILGLDPLTIANEGKLIVIVSPDVADAALAVMGAHPLGHEAALIGSAQTEPASMVFMQTDIGGKRVLDMLVGDPLRVSANDHQCA